MSLYDQNEMDGALTYLKHKLRRSPINTTYEFAMERLTQNVARIYVRNRETYALVNLNDIPDLRISVIGRVEGEVLAHNNEFLISWTDSYTIKINNEPVLDLTTQKQQSCRPLTHYTIKGVSGII